MKESGWQIWLDGLPSSRPQLQEVQANLERQVVFIEARLAAIGQGDRQAEERALRVKLSTLRSQLTFIHMRMDAA
ncbi:hypothetical protein [Deinococcus aquatilis]|uniref:hypothetical protein n=1 Tax=Deinococcus aquatilis TaxID=519440 RepID=UPI000364155C|nr:hypothetical protein [Deinococcus aquatilis]